MDIAELGTTILTASLAGLAGAVAFVRSAARDATGPLNERIARLEASGEANSDRLKRIEADLSELRAEIRRYWLGRDGP